MKHLALTATAALLASAACAQDFNESPANVPTQEPAAEGQTRAPALPDDIALETTALAEPSVMQSVPGEKVQFERTGYFFADPEDSKPGAPVFNRTATLKDSWAKDSSKNQ